MLCLWVAVAGFGLLCCMVLLVIHVNSVVVFYSLCFLSFGLLVRLFGWLVAWCICLCFVVVYLWQFVGLAAIFDFWC